MATRRRPAQNYAIRHAKPHLSQDILEGINRANIPTIDLFYYEDQTKDNPTYFIKLHNVHYRGEWENSLPNGRGWAIYPDGSYLQGNFIKGKVNDENGLLILKNGAVYKGNIVNSEIKGQGILTDVNYLYKGNWQSGKPHGQGQELFGKDNKGKIYKGNFVNGLKDGKGIYQDTDLAEKYDGQFKEGLMHGSGEYYVKNSLVYKGQFEKGQKVGYGQLITEKGVLKGKFENDVINGQGEFQWKDGRKYEGQFKDSKFHGKGKFTMKDGKVMVGEFRDGHEYGSLTMSYINQ